MRVLKTYSELRNESIRAKMTPKSEAELYPLYLRLLDNSDSRIDLLRDFQSNSPLFANLDDISSNLGEVGELYIITWDSSVFWEMNTVFGMLTEGERHIDVHVGENHVINGDWVCYPTRKVMGLRNNQHFICWIFDREFVKGLIRERIGVNEGVRDKMTPKSKDDIIDGVVRKILNKYTEDTVCFMSNEYNGVPSVTTGIATDTMDKVMKFGNGIYVSFMSNRYRDTLKEYLWKKNIAFSQVTATEIRINSHDKIQMVVRKMVEDVMGGNSGIGSFVIRKFNNLMR